jgi:hypothetical protein
LTFDNKVRLLSNVKASIVRLLSRLELAALHLFEEVLALDVGIIVLRRRQRLVVSAALARLRQLLGFGRVLPYQLG